VWTIRNMTRFYGEELLAPRPTPKLEDHPLSAVHDCLLNMFSGILHTGSNSSICNLRTRHAVVRGTHLLRLLMILKYVYYDLISDGSIPPSGSFSSSIFINNWRSRYSVSIPLGILYIGLWVPCTRRIYIYMHASVFSVVVLENVWLKYICKLKGFFLPSPIPPASKKKSSANWNYIYFGIHMYEPSLGWWICNSQRLLWLWQAAARSRSSFLGLRNSFQNFRLEQHPHSLYN